MSNYLIGKNKIIKDDSTIKNFAKSVLANIYIDDFKDYSPDEHDDLLLERVLMFLENTLPTTDVDFEKLMKQYRKGIGYILYDLDNEGCLLGIESISFFGEQAKKTFIFLIYHYIKMYLLTDFLYKNIENKI